MTVVRPNSISGINSITVATGSALNVHDADGNVINTITGASGVATYRGIHVGAGTTTSDQGISVGTGASIVSDTVNQLDVYTNNSKRLSIDSNGLVAISTNGLAPSSYGSPSVLVAGNDSTLTLMGNGSTNSSSFTGVKFRVAGGSSGDYTKAGIFAQRQGGYNDLDLIFAMDTAADANSVAISDEKVRITSAGLVGVGTDTPVTESGWGNTLHIHTAASGSNVRFSDGTSKGTNSDGSLVGHYTNDLYLINKEATGSIIANTNGSERLRIDSSGRLLIGSTASNQVWGLQGALQVEGLTGDTATANFISNQNSNAPFYLNFCKTRGTSDGSATVVQNGDFLGTIAFAGADGTDRECVGGRIDCIVAAAPGGNDMPGKITFSTTADGAVSPTLALTLDQSQNATFAGSVTDSKGNLRSIPRNDKTSNYTAVAGDAGKVITTDISSSGQVTINASVFSEGDALTILNYGSAAITIVQGSGMAITNCADGATGNRTLASKGMATLYFLGSTGAAISGAGIS